tara:strand:+ start:148 stop:321 length:174 start_codon:yes stop_codon:yes gene_type:complete
MTELILKYKTNIMKKLINKFNKLDNLNKGGIIFVVLFISPLLTAVIIDLIANGSKML